MTVFINNSVHQTTKVTPYQAIFGKQIQNQTTLGLYLEGNQAPLLADASLRKMVDDLTLQMRQLQDQLQKSIEQGKMKRWLAQNRHRRPHAFKLDDVVFIKEHRLPTTGTAPKFRPILQPSPFIVFGVNEHMVHVMRLADGFKTRVNPNDLLRIDLSDPPEFAPLDPSVLRELGRGFTAQALKRIAELDPLPLPSHEDSPKTPRKPSRTKAALKAEAADEADDNSDDDDGSGEDEFEPTADAMADEKTVRFNLDSPQ